MVVRVAAAAAARAACSTGLLAEAAVMCGLDKCNAAAKGAWEALSVAVDAAASAAVAEASAAVEGAAAAMTGAPAAVVAPGVEERSASITTVDFLFVQSTHL